MDHPGQGLIAIVVVNFLIWLATRWAHRWVPALNRNSDSGLYLILLPLGFGVFGFDLPYWSAAPIIIGGVVMLLYSLRSLPGGDRQEGAPQRASSARRYESNERSAR